MKNIERHLKEAEQELKDADRKIKKRHRYICGLVSEEKKEGLGIGDFFFESPDGQNAELYYALREKGWINSGYNAPYSWGVSKNGVKITYTEGDISIRPLKKNV